MLNQTVVEQLRWKKFPVLSDGFICLVDVMGDDNCIAQAARVSYGNDNPKVQCPSGCDEVVTGIVATDVKSFGINIVADVEIVKCLVCGGAGFLDRKGNPWKENDPKADRSLIRRLMRHRHTTPLEMAEVKLLVRVPMDTWRQWIRHRTANVNEYSTRYAPAIDSMDATAPDKWRLQSDENRQGSDGVVTEWAAGYSMRDNGVVETMEPDGVHWGLQDEDVRSPGGYLTAIEQSLQSQANFVYQERLKFGVAREQARKDLPLSTFTEAYWKCDLHNVLGFLALRMDSHAQQEIREYATIIGEQIIKPLFPIVWEAFEDYRLGGLHLTRLDIEVIVYLSGKGETDYECCPPKPGNNWEGWPAEWAGIEKCRERDECIQKLKKLGLIVE